ncbi:hypothetical protein RSOLAG1IB_10683 [Rhizoctonia solani AG-1 IB]|uniref:Uncharacterized protein n=1 Tax=Thanatephorus cucumeris (strain AG1-IB / isolate 7/3/14) TaxID=1108050 RepID=A0A0B7G1W5_THACB|nr:hypothetical protein RSOLAG1IB_10683 [Rhizoctonia solani AG-1 IB]
MGVPIKVCRFSYGHGILWHKFHLDNVFMSRIGNSRSTDSDVCYHPYISRNAQVNVKLISTSPYLISLILPLRVAGSEPG